MLNDASLRHAKEASPEKVAKLEQDVAKYHELDVIVKEATEVKDPLNKVIKTSMKELKLDEFMIGTLTASYSLQERTSMDEAKLLAFLEANGFEEAIQTVRRPNQQIVEDLVFQGKVKAEQLSHCVTTKEVEVLSVKNSAKKKKVK